MRAILFIFIVGFFMAEWFDGIELELIVLAVIGTGGS